MEDALGHAGLRVVVIAMGNQVEEITNGRNGLMFNLRGCSSFPTYISYGEKY